jgi:hypothetical protein
MRLHCGDHAEEKSKTHSLSTGQVPTGLERIAAAKEQELACAEYELKLCRRVEALRRATNVAL